MMKKRILRDVLVVCGCLLLMIPAGRAQDLPYDSGSSGADGPFRPDIGSGCGPRFLHAAAYDPVSGRGIAVDGVYYSSFPSGVTVNHYNNTATFDGTNWVSAGVGASNYARGARAAYDPQSGKVIRYGGQYFGSGSTRADVISWSGSAWVSEATTGAAGARAFYGMAPDLTAGELIVFGGYNGSAVINSTFAWNGTTKTWANRAPATSPPTTYYHDMCWDAEREEILLFGGIAAGVVTNTTWVWRDGNWSEQSPANLPPPRYGHAVGFDPVSRKVVCFGGIGTDRLHGDTWLWDGSDWEQVPDTSDALQPRFGSVMYTDTDMDRLYLVAGVTYNNRGEEDSWLWDGAVSNWVQVAGPTLYVDMSTRPDGVFNHTSIEIPAGSRVQYVGNEWDAPVRLLATESVTVDGTLSVDGEPGFARRNRDGWRARGGPGGYDGGLGGNRIEYFNTVAGTPGEGPGGGNASLVANVTGGNGNHYSVYGNAYIIPLGGGSGGGGGGASTTGLAGGNGGGGGGAILIASSRDIRVDGVISANGGYFGRNPSGNGYQGGFGSGGAVKLVADRILGTGSIQARNGQPSNSGTLGGYIRLESYLRPFDISGQTLAGSVSKAAPVLGVDYGEPPRLWISQIDGADVLQPPGGEFNYPDMVFSNAGPVSITVTSTNIPDGTPVRVKISHSSGRITMPLVNLVDSSASVTTNIPGGMGVVQATATYDIVP